MGGTLQQPSNPGVIASHMKRRLLIKWGRSISPWGQCQRAKIKSQLKAWGANKRRGWVGRNSKCRKKEKITSGEIAWLKKMSPAAGQKERKRTKAGKGNWRENESHNTKNEWGKS